MIFSKNFYLFGLLFLLLSCTSEKKEKQTENQKEIISTHSEQKLEIKKDLSTIKEGDIIFQTSTSSQSKAIQLATHSKYSHVGIIFRDKNNNSTDFVVLEAVQPVKFTPLNEWIKRGENSHFVIKRLKNADEVLTNEAIQKMKKIGQNLVGKNYDLYFEWSDGKIYCSELVWKIYKEALNIEVGKIEKLASFDLENEIVKQKMKERYGNKIPANQLDENVISPAAIFESDELVFVK